MPPSYDPLEIDVPRVDRPSSAGWFHVTAAAVLCAMVAALAAFAVVLTEKDKAWTSTRDAAVVAAAIEGRAQSTGLVPVTRDPARGQFDVHELFGPLAQRGVKSRVELGAGSNVLVLSHAGYRVNVLLPATASAPVKVSARY